MAVERASPPTARNAKGDQELLSASFEDDAEYPESVAFLDSRTEALLTAHFPEEHAILLFIAMTWAVLGSMGLGTAEAVTASAQST